MLVLQNEPHEGPGTLTPHLPSGTRVVRTWEEQIPAQADALLILGGGASAYDDSPVIRDQIRLIQSCVSGGGKALGICLGSQLLSLALGGSVARAPKKEIGFYRVRPSPEAASDPIFCELPESFVSFHWHSDAFTLPPKATPLASSTMTPLQAFRLGRAWGAQFHLELDASVLRSFVETGANDLADAAVDPHALLAAAPRELPRMAELAIPFFRRWLSA